jgi:hypothetical protein
VSFAKLQITFISLSLFSLLWTEFFFHMERYTHTEHHNIKFFVSTVPQQKQKARLRYKFRFKVKVKQINLPLTEYQDSLFEKVSI